MSYLLDLVYPPVKLDPSSLELKGVFPDQKFDGIITLYRYQPPLSNYIHDIKYRYQYTQIEALATISAHNIQANYKNILSYWQRHNFCLLPVPLHWARRNWRGFNQSQLLALHLAKLLALNYDNTILKRSVFTKPQVKLDEFSRQLHFSNKNIFTLNNLPKPGNYIIFDDVTTTHSTLNACLKPLLPYCEKKPWGLTIAG